MNRDAFVRALFAPRRGRRCRPEWHYAVVARLAHEQMGYSEMALRFGGGERSWSLRIAEAERRGLLRNRKLTNYALLLERSAPLADSFDWPYGAGL